MINNNDQNGNLYQKKKINKRIIDLDQTARNEFIRKYTNLEDYYNDKQFPNLHYPKQGKPNIKTELELGRDIAQFGYEVFILPETLRDKYGNTYVSNKPDAITGGLFLELKRLSTDEHVDLREAIQEEIRKASKQGDVSYIDIPFEVSLKTLQRAFYGQIYAGSDRSRYDGKHFIIKTKSSKGLIHFTIENNGVLSKGTPFGSPTLLEIEQSKSTNNMTQQDTDVKNNGLLNQLIAKPKTEEDSVILS